MSSGMMYFPVPWWNTLGNGLTFGQRPDPTWDFVHEGIELWQPDEVCEGPTSGEDMVCSSCAQKSCSTYWFTNHPYIPGEPTLVCREVEFLVSNKLNMMFCLPHNKLIYGINSTLLQPDDMYDAENEDEIQKWKDKRHPWTSPMRQSSTITAPATRPAQ